MPPILLSIYLIGIVLLTILTIIGTVVEGEPLTKKAIFAIVCCIMFWPIIYFIVFLVSVIEATWLFWKPSGFNEGFLGDAFNGHESELREELEELRERYRNDTNN